MQPPPGDGSRSHYHGDLIDVLDGDGNIVCSNEAYYPEPVTKENAELIVRAVNALLLKERTP